MAIPDKSNGSTQSMRGGRKTTWLWHLRLEGPKRPHSEGILHYNL